MIIKTSCHKGFKELIDYIMSDKGRVDKDKTFTIYHNLRSTNKDEIIREFQENDAYRKRRKRGVVLYHEMLSFSNKDRAGASNLDVLEDISNQFIKLRGPNALCLVKPHIENSNIHIHFCFSGTEYKNSKTLRLNHQQFRDVRLSMEKYQQKYPQLSNSICYLNNWQKNRFMDHEKMKTKDSEFQLKKRTKKPTDKEKVSEILLDCYRQSESKEDFFKRIIDSGIELYKFRNKINGIKYDNRKFRFKLLNITEKQISLLERNYNRLEELRKIHGDKQKSKEINRNI